MERTHTHEHVERADNPENIIAASIRAERPTEGGRWRHWITSRYEWMLYECQPVVDMIVACENQMPVGAGWRQIAVLPQRIRTVSTAHNKRSEPQQ